MAKVRILLSLVVLFSACGKQATPESEPGAKGGTSTDPAPPAAGAITEDDPATIAVEILSSYPDYVSNPKQFPVFNGKPVTLATTYRGNVQLAIDWAKRGKHGKLLERTLAQVNSPFR